MTYLTENAISNLKLDGRRPQRNLRKCQRGLLNCTTPHSCPGNLLIIEVWASVTPGVQLIPSAEGEMEYYMTLKAGTHGKIIR